jgi:hypothetical protein
MSNSIFGNLFGHAPVKQEGTAVSIDPQYDAIANNYGSSMHKSIAALNNSTALNHMNAIGQQNSVLRPAPEPKDVPALAISLDAAYDLWAAKYGYEWVNINIARTMPTGWTAPNGLYGAVPAAPTAPGTWVPVSSSFTVTVDTEQLEPEPEFDWYTVARRLTHVRALESEGGYYRLVPREWCK